MREILFRGKRIDNGEWVEGSFLLDGEAHRPLGKDHLPFSNSYIVPETDLENIDTVFSDGSYYLRTEGYHVIPETVGQFTGLTDKNGKKIFEGDIIEWDELEWGDKHRELVEWDYNLFAIRKDDWGEWCEVIGNIHDNPELLEVEGC